MEKYGTVPKRFTKLWWEYFWDYYKWHTIATVFVAVLVLVTAVQCVTQTKYDMTITIAGDKYLSEEQKDGLSSALGDIIADCDANGEKNVFLQTLDMGAESANSDPQYQMAVSTKLMLEFTAGESFMFILSKDLMNQYLNSDGSESMFIPVSEWAKEEVPDELCSKSGGVAYGVNLKESAYFASQNIDMTDMYLVVCTYRADSKKGEEQEIQLENSKTAASFLIAR
ncbi:MAG: hypothetical protein IJA39_01540 [Clostridia bacterium]|nr:hypothetical protein [Clostridia bacterium]